MASRRRRPTPLGRDFDRFWVAAAVSNLGDGIRLGALPLLAISLTDDARLIALVTAATIAPWFFFGPIGGAIVDREDRRRLIVTAHVVRAIAVGLLATLVAIDVVEIWMVIVVAFVHGSGEVIADSAAQAAVPQLVEEHQLDRANGRIAIALTLFDQVIGVALGTALFAAAAGIPFAIDAATFLIAAAVLASVRRPLQGDRASGEQRASVRRDVVEGARFLAGHRLLRGTMFAVATSNFAGNMAFGVFVVLVVDELGASEAAFGAVLAIGAIGGVIGSLVAGRLAERLGRRLTLSLLPGALVVTYSINALATAPWMASASFFISSLAIVCFNVPGQSLRQEVTPEHLLGRVVATFRMVGMGAAPVGAITGGIITESFDVRAANWAAAGVELVAWVMLLAALRHLPRPARRGEVS